MELELWHLLVTSIIGPLSFEIVRWRLKRRDDRERKEAENQDKKPTVEAALRSELREDNIKYRDQVAGLESLIRDYENERTRIIADHRKSEQELDKWRTAYYDIRKDKLGLEFEMKMVRKEVDILKAQLELRNITQKMIEGEGPVESNSH